jgi:hypothetical protein
VQDYTPTTERKQKPKVEGEIRFAELLGKFATFLDSDRRLWVDALDNAGVNEVLDPTEIYNFVQIADAKYFDHESYSNWAGHFFTHLISISKGKTFRLSLTSYTSYVCNRIEGYTINFVGNPGFRSAEYAKHCTFNLDGNAGIDFASGSEDCRSTITGDANNKLGSHSKRFFAGVFGNAARDCGRGAIDSRFMVHGNAGQGLGSKGRFSFYEIHGTVGKECGLLARDCTFKSPNLETALRMKEMVPAGNKVYHIDNCVEVLL